MDNYQTKINEVLLNLLNENEKDVLFEGGYLHRETDKRFEFIQESENYQLETVSYVPTMISGFLGKVNPSQDVFDENGTITIDFTPYVNEELGNVYNVVETFVKNLAGYSTSFTLNEETYNLVLNVSPITQGPGDFILNGEKVLYFYVTVYYRIFNCKAGNANTYRIRRLGEGNGDWKKLVRIGNTLGLASSLNASQKNNAREAEANKGSTAYTQAMTFYATDNCLTSDIENRLMPFFIENVEDAETLTENLTITKVYELELNINDKRGFRYVILENETYDDTIGSPITISVTFRNASQPQIDRERDRLGI